MTTMRMWWQAADTELHAKTTPHCTAHHGEKSVSAGQGCQPAPSPDLALPNLPCPLLIERPTVQNITICYCLSIITIKSHYICVWSHDQPLVTLSVSVGPRGLLDYLDRVDHTYVRVWRLFFTSVVWRLGYQTRNFRSRVRLPTMTLPGYFWDTCKWRSLAGELSWDITTIQVNWALHPYGVAKSSTAKLSTSFGSGKGGKVTDAGWQVTL